jgi:hypothetical protein
MLTPFYSSSFFLFVGQIKGSLLLTQHDFDEFLKNEIVDVAAVDDSWTEVARGEGLVGWTKEVCELIECAT